MIDLGCVVVCYRTPGDLQQFIDSFLVARTPDTYLVIVDVDPLDQSVGATAAIKHHNVEYLAISHNLGYARACNMGADHLSARNYAFFNADIVLTPDSLRCCLNALDDHPKWGVLGPRQVDTRGRITAGGILGPPTAPAHRGWQEQDRGQYQDIVTDCPTVAGSALFVKAAVWKELTDCALFQSAAPHALGAFLPTQMYYEETYLCYHAKGHGWDVVYYGVVTITHKWQQSVKKNGVDEWARHQAKIAREQFREACRMHHLACD